MKTFDQHQLNESSDSKDPKYIFSGTPTVLLAKIANGKVDIVKYAKMEMKERGLGKKGEWLGYGKAAKVWGLKLHGNI